MPGRGVWLEREGLEDDGPELPGIGAHQGGGSHFAQTYTCTQACVHAHKEHTHMQCIYMHIQIVHAHGHSAPTLGDAHTCTVHMWTHTPVPLVSWAILGKQMGLYVPRRERSASVGGSRGASWQRDFFQASQGGPGIPVSWE